MKSVEEDKTKTREKLKCPVIELINNNNIKKRVL